MPTAFRVLRASSKEAILDKFGWDLPPGCRISDIPGNSPEDQRMEAWYDTLADILVEAGWNVDDEKGEKALEALAKVVGKSYCDGYAEGASDAAMVTLKVLQMREEKDENPD
jgi:hypothetical protein